ncbi:MAG: FHA domain-containing protein, partial [Myxococcota bacterium]
MPAPSDPAASSLGSATSSTGPGPRTVGLRAYRGEDSLGNFVFDREIVKIGRLASAHLQLDDPKVSRIHAVIDFSGSQQGPAVIDMGSAEGTFVNGERVSRVQLKDDDEIRLGDTRLKVCLSPASIATLQQEGASVSSEGDPVADSFSTSTGAEDNASMAAAEPSPHAAPSVPQAAPVATIPGAVAT